MVRRRDEDILNEIRLLRPHPRNAAAAAALAAIGRKRHALDIVVMRERDHDILFGNEILNIHRCC